MEVFFADDSVQRASRRGVGRLVAFGGVAFNEVELAPVAAAMNEIAARYGVPADIEFKWSPDPRKDRWLHDEFKDPHRRDCYGEILRVAKDHGGRAIVVVTDTGRTGQHVSDASDRCVKYAFERFETHLEKSDRLGLVVADRPGGGKPEEDAFLRSFLLRITLGTEYKTGANVPVNVLTTPSHLVRHLQIADLVTGIAAGAVGGSRYASALAPSLQPLFLGNAMGAIGGRALSWIRASSSTCTALLRRDYIRQSRFDGPLDPPCGEALWPPRAPLPDYTDDGL